MILMLDNYDSFTYNLVQYFGELGAKLKVYRNDAITVAARLHQLTEQLGESLPGARLTGADRPTGRHRPPGDPAAAAQEAVAIADDRQQRSVGRDRQDVWSGGEQGRDVGLATGVDADRRRRFEHRHRARQQIDGVVGREREVAGVQIAGEWLVEHVLAALGEV